MTEARFYVYVLHVTRLAMLTDGPTVEEDAALARHFAYLQRLTESGVLMLAGRTLPVDESTFGIALLRAAGADEAEQVMLADPAVAEGIMRAALYPFRIALASPDALGVG